MTTLHAPGGIVMAVTGLGEMLMEDQISVGITPSRAPNLAAQDGLSPLARVTQQPLMLGLFLPIQSGAWTPTTAPRGTDWTFDYNAKLMVQADELGFDLAFGLAQ